MVNQENRTRRDRGGEEDGGITERTVRINRVSKVVKGGRHLSFSAMVVVGYGEGRVGIGMGKADAVPDAIKKGSTYAHNNMLDIPMKGDTIPHEVTVKYGGTMVMLKPAPPGTGVIKPATLDTVLKSISPIKELPIRFIPTSMTMAPDFTIFGVINLGFPIATTRMSASLVSKPRSIVRE